MAKDDSLRKYFEFLSCFLDASELKKTIQYACTPPQNLIGGFELLGEMLYKYKADELQDIVKQYDQSTIEACIKGIILGAPCTQETIKIFHLLWILLSERNTIITWIAGLKNSQPVWYIFIYEIIKIEN